MIAQRIVSAVILAAALLALLLWLPAIWTVVAITAAVMGGAWEWSGFLRTGTAGRTAFLALIAAGLAGAWFASASAAGLALLLYAAAAWWIIAFGWILFAPRVMNRALAWLSGVVTLVPAWVAIVRMRLDWEFGARWVLFLLLLVWAADIGAYFAGRTLGRHKLAPAVSPGKTWEGVAGGLVAAMAVAAACAGWLVQPTLSFVAVALVVAVASIVGDLTESMLKRFSGLKDSGRLIPGHGGIMDRMDSITAAAPCLMLGVGLLRGLVP